MRLVIFDCDGVLVDSEPVANAVVADALTALGWPTTPRQAEHRFLGMSFPDMLPVIETRLGRPLPPGWGDTLVAALMRRMETDVTAIDGAIDALDGVEALGLPWRIASNSSHAEMGVKFRRIGLAARAAGRAHSFEDVPRGKPAPGLFLAAAAAQGVAPGHCVVVEDSRTGARAARAAGMRCLGYAPGATGPALAEEGAEPFADMRAVPALLRRILAEAA